MGGDVVARLRDFSQISPAKREELLAKINFIIRLANKYRNYLAK